MRFLDANIILRYLTRDDPEKAQACYQLFQRVKRGEEEIATCGAVIAEVVYVLACPPLYNLPPDRIRSLLLPIIALPGLRLEGKRTYAHALDIFAILNIDFEDALIVAQMQRQGLTDIYSYDADFDRIEGINRLEPPMS